MARKANAKRKSPYPSWPMIDVLAAAVAVFREYGFVRSGGAYWDSETETTVHASKDIIMHTLAVMNGADRHDYVQIVEVTEEDRARAVELRDFYDQKTVIAKLKDKNTDFDNSIMDVISKDRVDSRGVGILASLPNGYVIEQKRMEMRKFYAANRNIGSYIGNVKDRIKVTALVRDVKWIPNHGIYLVTMITDENQLVKFFLKDKDADLSEQVKNKRIVFLGTVKKQEVSDYTQCHETMFNRVRVLEMEDA